MLILTRRKGESIIIDGDIEVTVVDISGGTVRVGIDAPDEINIVRNELLKDGNNERQAG